MGASLPHFRNTERRKPENVHGTRHGNAIWTMEGARDKGKHNLAPTAMRKPCHLPGFGCPQELQAEAF